MKELLVQNYLKKYMNRVEPSTANNVLIARVISSEVDAFIEREKGGQGMNQKALRELEKDIEARLKQDSRLQILDIPTRQSIQEGFQAKRDMSQQPYTSKAPPNLHNSLVLPKIGAAPSSMTPVRAVGQGGALGLAKQKALKSFRNSTHQDYKDHSQTMVVSPYGAQQVQQPVLHQKSSLQVLTQGQEASRSFANIAAQFK